MHNGAFKATEIITLAIKLQLATATRIGEVTGARWDEIDLEHRWWEIPAERMKNKRIHRVWLAAPAVDALERLRAIQAEQGRASEWVFVSPRGESGIAATSVNRAITRNQNTIGVEHFAPHDLRRTVSTRLAESGVLPHILDKVLSHSDQSVRGKHYDKFSYDTEKRKALETWAVCLDEIVTGSRRDNVIPIAR